MPDSSAIGNALVAKLGAHAPLLALMPNGVYEDFSPQGSDKYVTVSLIIGMDTDIFNARGFEEHHYEIFARGPAASAADVHTAATIIDDLLVPQPPAAQATLTVAGYSLMTITREEFLRGREVDEVDASIIRVRRGGRYLVACSL